MHKNMVNLGSQLHNSQVSLPNYGEDDNNYCSICYTNEIWTGPGPINDDDMTMEFGCKHRFCMECCRTQLEQQIQNNALSKIVCMEYKCGQKITEEELQKIFKDNPVIVEKLTMFR